ncbi:MAG: GNAT family N-acetyltransferase [Acetobacteraceae bacterium]
MTPKQAATDQEDYRLRRPASDAEWNTYHAIRQRVMFEDGEVDLSEELAPGHYPLILWLGAAPIGTIRIDSLDGEAAAFRLVAIDPDNQGRGHGRALLRQAEMFAREIGCRKAVVYSTPEAAGFYESAGYAEDPFDDEYFGGIVQMAKPLHYAGFSLEDEG